MSLLEIQDFVEETNCSVEHFEMEDYAGAEPRWCKGCGDLGLLSAMQKVLRDNQLSPENVVCVSGIGCSSRFPHYLGVYGFHGLHGRALPLSTGVALARPDLKVITVMGDGDCFSIGAGHWMHAIRYNLDITVFVLDNEIYALTKKQTSPTTRMGVATNTTPTGAFLKSLNPLSLVLGVSNVSFVAQTATWLASHMEATVARAWEHKGLSFVRVLQRCPAFRPKGYGSFEDQLPVTFLENEGGIEVHKGFLKDAPVISHDYTNLNKAQKLVSGDELIPAGLIYCNEDVPTYQDVRFGRITKVNRSQIVEKLNTQLDKHAIIK